MLNISTEGYGQQNTTDSMADTWTRLSKVCGVKTIDDINRAEIYRLKVINANSLFQTVSVFVNEELFHLPVEHYLDLRNYCASKNIPVIEPTDNYWIEINNKVDEIQDTQLVVNFIKYVDKKFFLKPEYFYEVQDGLAEHLIYNYKIDLTKKKKQVLQEEMESYNYEFDRFVSIAEKEYGIKKIYRREVVWKLLKKEMIKYFSNNWIKSYNNGNELVAESLEGVIDEALEINGLGKRKDDKYAQFIYYCVYKNLTNAKNFYDAWFELENAIKERIRIRDTDLLERRLKGNVSESKYTIDDVDLMDGHEFEEFICKLFIRMGYDAQVTKQSGDQGLDVIAEKAGNRIGVQAKCYSGTVGNSAIQEAVAGKRFYNCNKVVVVTNNYFTSSAVELAEINDVILWNRDILKMT